MIVDTSALMAILLDEPEADRFVAAIKADEVRFISAGTLLECGIVADNKGVGPELDALVDALSLRPIPVNEVHVDLARRAYREFGRGNSAARLNFGDCFSYVLAKGVDEPLLFKGDDFSQTDVASAL